MKQQFFWTGLGVIIIALCPLKVRGADRATVAALKNGTSIRGASMGFAFTAVAEENGAFGYNPAGFAVPGGSFRTDNYDYNGDISSGYGGNYLYLYPLGFGKWRRNANGQAIDVTGYGYGRRGRGVDFGVLYKTVEVSGTVNQNGWSSDVGAIFRVAPFMDIGVVGQDVFKKNVDVDPSVRVGLALFDAEKNFKLTSDAVLERIDSEDQTHVSVGCEYMLTDGVQIRGGVAGQTITGGLSLALPFVEAEYGVVNDRGTKSTYHMLGFKFGRGTMSVPQRRQYSVFKEKTFAEFNVAGNLVEGRSEFSLLNGNKIGANDLMALIHEAAQDPDCEGFIVNIGDLSGSLWGISMIQEVRSELLQAKAKGKYIVAYLEGFASLPEYYLASIGDQIIMPDLGVVGYLGIKYDVIKTRYLLNNFGVNYTLIQSGKYKTAMYSVAPTMDAAEHALMEDVVYEMYHDVIADIKSARKIDWTKLSNVFDGHMITAKEALEIGMIDHLGYPTDVETIASAALNGKNIRSVPITEFGKEIPVERIFSPFNRLAVVEIDGEITSGHEESDYLFGKKATGAENIEQILESVKADGRVAGVLLRVNSPGGSMLGSDRIYSALQKVKAKGIPIYVSMGSVAASGGYYVSLAGDKIFANPCTLTGSIGVVSMHPNYSELNTMLDIRREVIATGKYMDLLDANAPTTTDDVKMATEFQEKFYSEFTEKVKQSRNLSDIEIDQIAQGQVVLGNEAQKLKIVDEIGTLYDAIDALSTRTHISNPELVYFRPSSSFWSNVFDHGLDSAKMMLGLR